MATMDFLQRQGDPTELLRKYKSTINFNLRVCVPCIVQSFDVDAQTIVARPAIREQLVDENGNKLWKDIPDLLDVPIVIPRAGGYVMTFPIQKGDECLVIFGDSCMDAWWQNGGVQNQVEMRRHDLSDGFAILGCWSQPRVVSHYSPDSVQLRNESKSSIIEIRDTTDPDTTTINVSTSGTANINAGSGTINLTTSGTINIGSGDVKINNKIFLQHKHTGVEPGSGQTGGVA